MYDMDASVSYIYLFKDRRLHTLGTYPQHKVRTKLHGIKFNSHSKDRLWGKKHLALMQKIGLIILDHFLSHCLFLSFLFLYFIILIKEEGDQRTLD